MFDFDLVEKYFDFHHNFLSLTSEVTLKFTCGVHNQIRFDSLLQDNAQRNRTARLRFEFNFRVIRHPGSRNGYTEMPPVTMGN